MEMVEHIALGNVLVCLFILFYREAHGNAGTQCPWKCFIDAVVLFYS